MLISASVFVGITIFMPGSSIVDKVVTPIALLFGLALRAFTAANLKHVTIETGLRARVASRNG